MKFRLLLASLFAATVAQAANPVIVIETSKGDIKVELFEDKAPITVKNFLKYVDDKHFDGLTFHRVISNFMIQGGGYDADQKERKTRDPIKNESGNGVPNNRGYIAMARTDDLDTATSQFYINVKDNPNLDESDWTALRKPPLLHFSDCQPSSMTTGRKTSSEVSSQMNDAKASRLPCEPAFQGAFMALLSAAVRGGLFETVFASRLGGTIAFDRLGRTHHEGLADAPVALEQMFRVGDHCRKIAVGGTSVIAASRIFQIGIRLGGPVGAAGNRSLGAGNDDARSAGVDVAGGDRRAVIYQQAKPRRKVLDRAARGAALQRIVDRNPVAVTQSHRFEPAGKPAFLRKRQAAGTGGDIECVIDPFNDGLMNAIQRAVAWHAATASQREAERESNGATSEAGRVPEQALGHGFHLT